MDQKILTKLDDGVLTLTLNRPEKKNALTAEMYSKIDEAIIHAENEPSIKVVLITGYGDIFTSGNDIEDFLSQPISNDSPVVKFLLRISSTDIPIIAAVNGPAIGVGTTMLLHCDKVFATEDSNFATPFTSLGVVPEAGSSLLMPKYLGYQTAARLLMFSESLSCDEALSCGLISQKCESSDLLNNALAEAKKIAKLPKNTVRKAKMMMRRVEEPLTDRVIYEMQEFGSALHSPESREAMLAFIEKRPPDFSKIDS